MQVNISFIDGVHRQSMHLYRRALSLHRSRVLIDTKIDFTEIYGHFMWHIKRYKDIHEITIVIDCKINTAKGSCTKWAFNL